MEVNENLQVDSERLKIKDSDKSTEGGPHPGYVFIIIFVVFLVAVLTLITFGLIIN